ncbi:MAG: DUF2784 domain-containing protein [Steroidobacteraceae bacterium]
MIYRVSADLVLVVHLAFVLFVVLGGLLVLRWTRLVWLHLPALLWGAVVEFFGLICPLTTLEWHLRELGTEGGYEGDFIGHYVTALLYPSGLTRQLQIGLGVTVLLTNLLIYVYFLIRIRRP